MFTCLIVDPDRGGINGGAKNRIDTGRWGWVDGDRVQDAFFLACLEMERYSGDSESYHADGHGHGHDTYPSKLVVIK